MIVNLYEDESIQAIIELLREDKYSLRVIEILSRIGIKAKAYTERMWEKYEEKHQFIHPIEFLLLIAKIESRESKAIELLQKETTIVYMVNILKTLTDFVLIFKLKRNSLN